MAGATRLAHARAAIADHRQVVEPVHEGSDGAFGLITKLTKTKDHEEDPGLTSPAGAVRGPASGRAVAVSVGSSHKQIDDPPLLVAGPDTDDPPREARRPNSAQGSPEQSVSPR